MARSCKATFVQAACVVFVSGAASVLTDPLGHCVGHLSCLDSDDGDSIDDSQVSLLQTGLIPTRASKVSLHKMTVSEYMQQEWRVTWHGNDRLALVAGGLALVMLMALLAVVAAYTLERNGFLSSSRHDDQKLASGKVEAEDETNTSGNNKAILMPIDEVDALVERIGFGKQQVLVLIPGGFAYATTSAVTIGTAQAAIAVVSNAGSETHGAGVLTSILFGGYLFGNLLGGPLSDQHGRRVSLMVSFAGVTFFQSLIGILGDHGFWMLGAWLAGCGVFMGIGLAGANANMKEWTPSHLRSTLFCMLFVFLTFGQLAVATYLSLTSPDLSPGNVQWKFLFLLMSLVSGSLLFFSAMLLPESPQWLKQHMRLQDAQKELILAADRNGVDLDVNLLRHGLSDSESNGDIDEATALKDAGAKSQSIFSGRLLQTTVIGCYLNFATNACYYGIMCTLPDTLSNLFKGTGVAATFVMLISTIFELPGIIVQDVLGRFLSRQVNLAVAFASVSISSAFLASGLAWRASAVVILGSMFVKFAVIASFIITYLALAEAYPDSCRATGSGVCMTIGRLGAMAASLLYDEVGDISFYLVLCVLSLLAAIAGYWMRTLEE